MEKIILKELVYQDIRIKFKIGLNYIIGPNGSGKTTIYNLIQFVLGLKKEMKNSFFINSSTSPITLLCNIGEREVRFQRYLYSEYISIQYDETNESVRYLSSKLKDIYDFLFEPFFVYENEKGAAYDIIKNSFLSEFKFDITRGRNDSLKKLLGVNVSYIRQATNDFRELQNNLQNEKKSIQLLEDFISKIHITNNEMKKVDSIKLKELLESEYKTIVEKHRKTIEFLQLAENVLYEKEEFLEEYLDRRISIFESYYGKLIDQLGLNNNSNSFRDYFKSKSLSSNTSSSYRFYTEFLCFILTLTRNLSDERHNGCGLLISDLSLSNFDDINRYSIEKVIKNETELGQLQYIEFTTNYSKELPKDTIVFDLGHLERFI
jgi:predicted ATP-dependent endonuclease of OLD family